MPVQVMFLPFLLRLFGGSIFPLFLLSVLSTPVFGVDALSLPKRGKGPVGLSIGLMLVRSAAQTYIWLGWAAYCVALALRYTESPSVDNSIVYYAAAFIAANLPITFLALKESAVTETDGQRYRIQRGTAFYRIVTLTAFMIFCISPQLMRGPYGWMVERIVPSDSRIEVAELLREAMLGDAEAQYQLATAHAEGRLVARDRSEAERWHLAAARQGHRGSQSRLCIGLLGNGTLGQSISSTEWCASAAEQGDPESAFQLANMYANGDGVEVDRTKASEFYAVAAEGGVAEAQIIVGLDYADDGNLPIDSSRPIDG